MWIITQSSRTSAQKWLNRINAVIKKLSSVSMGQRDAFWQSDMIDASKLQALCEAMIDLSKGMFEVGPVDSERVTDTFSECASLCERIELVRTFQSPYGNTWN